jgi:hypothetical protein
MTSVTVETRKQQRRQAAMIGLSIVGAIAVALGLVAWQDWKADDTIGDASQTSGDVARTAMGDTGYRPDIDIPADGPIGNLMRAPAGRAATPTLYLVATPQEAVTVQAMISGDVYFAGVELGEPPMPAAVAVVGSAADEQRVLLTIAHADAASAEMGVPALRVVDLRTP